MSARHVIVDGSNIATEGRSLPSLAQLDQAVREYLAENPDDIVTVVVDASFGHRIDPSELTIFEGAEAAGEVISPPAGAIGRGDAFLLRIAEKTGATVLSNDSFQEFHGEHPWLFEQDRLIGGKPVPGVGWIFMERTPVRGPKSREVVKDAKRKKQAQQAADGPPEATGLDLAASRSKGRGKKIDRAIARATEEVVAPKSAKPGRRRRGGTPPAEAVNEPLPFITFIAEHPLGSTVVGMVTEYASHGVFIEADGNKCYMPLAAMGEPPPRRARDVVTRGEEKVFVVQALDPQRRGIELGLPGFARVTGVPTPEMVEAEIHPEQVVKPERRRAKSAVGTGSGADGRAEPAPAKKAAPKKAAPKKATPAQKAAPQKAAPKKATPTEKAAPKKATPAKEAVGGTAKKAAAKKAGPAVKKTAPPTGTAVKQAAPAKKAAAKKAAPAKKAARAKKAAPANRAAPAKQAAPAKKAAATDAAGPGAPEVPEKALARKAAPARKAGVTKATAPANQPAPATKTTATRASRTRKAGVAPAPPGDPAPGAVPTGPQVAGP